ncbi:uncharacterized protein LOC116024902 isoform X2 [Ipomoea triloba]|uniref:uncharacterized protein LOC116024902 isoform X2 n=1 Tax=Ipomoea triloba TaxID=35885 RepID=UPI00125E7BF9|nr:uncharacterized protein LOC116024902 isoform X2 [Ipomoea triloba]XP_031121797.1 uncharacterized protein LOC116024902 isoform X2 [Ipomoea triloba]XP_031121798.1 uncharacterized protein LOC116024902 isoform X2 [Ipomoea triloba]
MQPTEAPQVQVIERAGSDNPNDDGTSVQREMSISSHESLFSIHVDSFTRCQVPGMGADLPNPADVPNPAEQDMVGENMVPKQSISLRGGFQDTGGGEENNKEDLGPDNGPVSSQTKVELAKEKRKSGEHKGSSALLTRCCCCCKSVTWMCGHCKTLAWSSCISLPSCSCKRPTWQSFMCNYSICCGRRSSNTAEKGPEQHTKSSKKASGQKS